ncbi:MAG: aspartate--tRNA(Asn) ligase, partial [Candidatus Micrarchaeota archaeon]
KIIFLKIRDREGLVQVIVKSDDEKMFSEIQNLTPETVVAVHGTVKASKQAKGGYEIAPEKVEVLSRAEVPLPLDISGKIDSELDTRLNSRFMDLRQDKTKAVFMIRDCVTTAIHRTMDDMGFIEISSPKIVSGGVEGGATLFPMTYFGRPAFLSQSPQLYKQMMMATGFDKVYEIAPVFRAEKSDTNKHLAEFTGFDVEMAFIKSWKDVAKVLEDIVVDVYKHVEKHAKNHLEVLKAELEVPKKPFVYLTHDECNKLLKRKPFQDIGTDDEKKLGEMVKNEYDHDFLFITEFPSCLKAETFYVKRNDEKPEYTTSFDLEIKGQELVTGNQREHRYAILMKQMKEAGANPGSFDFYLDTFRYGMPPHGGFGMGIDRFVQKMLDLPNIREAVLHPRDMKRVTP